MVAELLANQLDLALIALPYDAGSLETMTIYREPLHLAFCDGSSIVEDRLINFDDLPDESLLLLDDGHCLRDHALAGCRLKSHKDPHVWRKQPANARSDGSKRCWSDHIAANGVGRRHSQWNTH